MDIVIDDKTYGVVLGFGNVMRIQAEMAGALQLDDSTVEALKGKEDLSIAELESSEQEAMMNNMNAVPACIALCLRSVNGRPITNVKTYVDDEMDMSHGIKLFEHIMSHIGEMLVPKVSSA
mgnify:CR=1 FL=1|tara:strand:- start:598 stop:960 length:363 start_codon:yes stop_codon:yes gene_type:complete